jgi:hypothetical protein
MERYLDGTRRLFDDGRGITATDGQTTESAPPAVSARLEYLRGELRAQRISWGELAELESLVPYIAPDDVELLEAAGVPESVPAPEDHSADHHGEMDEAGYPAGH